MVGRPKVYALLASALVGLGLVLVPTIPAVANAVMNALRPLGIERLDFPYSAARVWQAIATARRA